MRRTRGTINIKKAEEAYEAKFLGLFDLPEKEGPFYIFYQSNPNLELGHNHYFGLFVNPLTNVAYITSAASITEARYPSLYYEGEWLTSQYHHHYVSKGAAVLDGGLDYTRYNPDVPPTHLMRFVDGERVYEPINGTSSYYTGEQNSCQSKKA